MAGKLTHRQTDELRDRIFKKSAKLINHMLAFALSEDDPLQPGNPMQMSREQLNAGINLLKKVVPDQQYIEHSEEPQYVSIDAMNDMIKQEILRIAQDNPEQLVEVFKSTPGLAKAVLEAPEAPIPAMGFDEPPGDASTH